MDYVQRAGNAEMTIWFREGEEKHTGSTTEKKKRNQRADFGCTRSKRENRVGGKWGAEYCNPMGKMGIGLCWPANKGGLKGKKFRAGEKATAGELSRG